MADSTLDSELIVLLSGRFGAPNVQQGELVAGILGALHHNVAVPYFPVGSVVRLYNSSNAGQPGFSEFVYLRYNDGGAPPAMAAKQVAIPTSATVWYHVTNDPDNAAATPTEGNPLAVVCLSVMTDTYYGWFWCGGICPEDHVVGLAGNFATEGNVAAGPIVSHDLAADAIGFGPVGGDTEAFIGYALAADAA